MIYHNWGMSCKIKAKMIALSDINTLTEIQLFVLCEEVINTGDSNYCESLCSLFSGEVALFYFFFFFFSQKHYIGFYLPSCSSTFLNAVKPSGLFNCCGSLGFINKHGWLHLSLLVSWSCLIQEFTAIRCAYFHFAQQNIKCTNPQRLTFCNILHNVMKAVV